MRRMIAWLVSTRFAAGSRWCRGQCRAVAPGPGGGVAHDHGRLSLGARQQIGLPSKPATKSFASVSSPMLACTTVVSARARPLPAPTTSAAPSSSRDPHWLTPYCCANSAPLLLALHGSQCYFRLERRAAAPPRPLAHLAACYAPAWPISDRQSTHPHCPGSRTTSQQRDSHFSASDKHGAVHSTGSRQDYWDPQSASFRLDPLQV